MKAYRRPSDVGESPGDDRPSREYHGGALEVVCPYCGASVGIYCKTKFRRSGLPAGQPCRRPHDQRIAKAKETAE